MADPIIICPTEEELLKDSQRNLLCSEAGCQRRFPTLPALWMHNAKTHGVYKDDWHKEAYYNNQGKKSSTTVTKRFLCPVDGCSRGKLFDRMVSLKTHYINVHAEKKFPCDKCGRKFGSLKQQGTHTARCGQILTCSCGSRYTTPEALYMHARRHKHDFTEEFKNTRKYCWKRKDLEAECHGVAPPPQKTRTKPSGQGPLLPKASPVFILHQIVKPETVTEQTQTDGTLGSDRQSKRHSSAGTKTSKSSKGKSSSRKGKHPSKRKTRGVKVAASGIDQTQDGRRSSRHAPSSFSEGSPACSNPHISHSYRDVSSGQNPTFLVNSDVHVFANVDPHVGSVLSGMEGPLGQFCYSSVVTRLPPPTYVSSITSGAADALTGGQFIRPLGAANDSQQYTSTSAFGSSVSHSIPQTVNGPLTLLGDGRHRSMGYPSKVRTLSSEMTCGIPPSADSSLQGRVSSTGTTTELLSDPPMLEPPDSPSMHSLQDLSRDSPSLHSIPNLTVDSNDSVGFRSIGTTLETLGVPTQTDFDFLNLLESCDIHTQTIESIFAGSPVPMETSGTQTQVLRKNMATNLPLTNEAGTLVGDLLGQTSIQTQTQGALLTNAQTLTEDILEMSMNQASLHARTPLTEEASTLVEDILELGMTHASLQTHHTLLTNEVQTLVQNGCQIEPDQAPTQTQAQQIPLTNEAQTLVGDVVELAMSHASMQTETQAAEQSSIETQTQTTTLGLLTRTEELQTMTHAISATSPFAATPSPLQQESQETQTIPSLSSHDLLSLDIYTQTGLSDLSGDPSLDELEFSDIHTQTMDDFDLGIFGIDLTSASVQTDLPLVDSGVTVGTQVQSQFLQSGMVSANVQTDRTSGSSL